MKLVIIFYFLFSINTAFSNNEYYKSQVEKDAKKGLKNSQLELSKIFLSEKKIIQSFVWAEIAKKNGHASTDKVLIELEKQMSNTDYNYASTLAEQCLKTNYENCTELFGEYKSRFEAINMFLEENQFSVDMMVGVQDREKLVELKEKADNGDIRSQVQYGMLHLQDTPYFKKNVKKAIKYIKKASDSGYDLGTFFLASIYADTKSSEYNIEKAILLYHKAATNDEILSQEALANYYKKNNFLDKAKDFYKRCADNTKSKDIKLQPLILESKNNCRVEYAYWLLDSNKKEEAINYFRRAAKDDDKQAQAQLGYELCVPFDKNSFCSEEGFNWLVKAANNGMWPSQYYLGAMLCRGKYTKQNHLKGISYLEQALKNSNQDKRIEEQLIECRRDLKNQ
tara:strand:+ start:227 stop:1414 length:1188 start_codon:yes stop_codon:yes gene_type:complete